MEKDNRRRNTEMGLLEERIVKLEEAKELIENIIDAVREPLIVMDADLRVLSVNNTFYDTFEVRSDQTIGNFIYDLGNKQWNIPKLKELLGSILPNNASFDNYVIEHDFETIGRRTMVLNARRIPRPPEKTRLILLAVEDITDMDKVRMAFEKMMEYELFSKVAREKENSIIQLRKEVNGLLIRLGEKLKYTNGNGKQH